MVSTLFGVRRFSIRASRAVMILAVCCVFGMGMGSGLAFGQESTEATENGQAVGSSADVTEQAVSSTTRDQGVLQDLLPGMDRLGLPDQAEMTAPIVDLYAQPAFDLAQVFIQLPADTGQPFVVLGQEIEIEGFWMFRQDGFF